MFGEGGLKKERLHNEKEGFVLQKEADKRGMRTMETEITRKGSKYHSRLSA